MGNWTFITNHGAVLAIIARHRKIKAIDIAFEVGLTERSVRRIIADLERDGYITKTREAGVSRYEIKRKLPLRRTEAQNITVEEFIKIFVK
jgi:DNA-binding MarR family transcriptional regulator